MRDRGIGRAWWFRAVAAAALALSLLPTVDAHSSAPSPQTIDDTTDGHARALTGKLVAAIHKPLPVVPVDGGSDIWVFDSSGRNGVNLTSWMTDDEGVGTFEIEPIWSRDGTQIAFGSTCCRPGSGPKLWVMDADGSNARRLTTDPIDFWWLSEEAFAWSPDGDRLTFVRGGKGGQAYTIRVDGSDEKPIPGVGWLDISWSPINDWFVFTPPSIYDPLMLVTADGTSMTPLPTSGVAAAPQWSPDGQWIAYTECNALPQDSCSDPAVGVLRVIRPDGTGGRVLAENAYLPTWSPDGSTILFQRSTGIPIANAIIFTYHTVPFAGGPISEIIIDYPDGTLPFGRVHWQPIPLSDRPAIAGLIDPSQGLWHLYDDSGDQTTKFFFGNPGDVPIVGDWNCDGVETPGMYRQSDGYVYLRNSNTQGAADVRFFFGDPGDVPIAGDFNDDGCDTVSIYRPANQTFYIINALGANDGGLGAAEFSYVFGDPGDKPFVGDFDGDGVETVGLHRESTGLVYFRNSHTQGNADAQFIFGDPGDRLIAGDWNGDGSYSPALFRPSSTTMFFRYTNTQGNADNQFIPAGSAASWVPVAGVFK